MQRFPHFGGSLDQYFIQASRHNENFFYSATVLFCPQFSSRSIFFAEVRYCRKYRYFFEARFFPTAGRVQQLCSWWYQQSKQDLCKQAALADCKQFFRELPDNLTLALTQAFTSKSYLQLQNTESSSLLINQLAIIAEIYLFWFRSQHNEEETGIRRNSLQRNMQELFQNHLNCDTTVDLANTFVHIFYK